MFHFHFLSGTTGMSKRAVTLPVVINPLSLSSSKYFNRVTKKGAVILQQAVCCQSCGLNLGINWLKILSQLTWKSNWEISDKYNKFCLLPSVRWSCCRQKHVKCTSEFARFMFAQQCVNNMFMSQGFLLSSSYVARYRAQNGKMCFLCFMCFMCFF